MQVFKTLAASSSAPAAISGEQDIRGGGGCMRAAHGGVSPRCARGGGDSVSRTSAVAANACVQDAGCEQFGRLLTVGQMAVETSVLCIVQNCVSNRATSLFH
jgi:hypothetical protein